MSKYEPTLVSKDALRILKEVQEQGGIPAQKLRAKCNWEQMSQTAVIKNWGDPRNWK